MRAFFAQLKSTSASEAPSSSARRASDDIKAAAQNLSQPTQDVAAPAVLQLSTPDARPGSDTQAEELGAGSARDVSIQVRCKISS